MLNKFVKRLSIIKQGNLTANAATGRTPPPVKVTPGTGRPAGPIKPTDPGRRANDAAATPITPPGVASRSSNLW